MAHLLSPASAFVSCGSDEAVEYLIVTYIMFLFQQCI